MTIASKTILVNFRKVRAGAPYVDVATKSSIDLSDISGYVRAGNTFFGVGNTTTETFPSEVINVRNGSQYIETTTKSTIDSSYGQGKVRFGIPFVAPFAGTSSFVSSAQPVRAGQVFKDITAKSSINASEFDVVRRGSPFWVAYAGPPPAFDTTRFFLMF